MNDTNHLYPLKFAPILKDHIWGGNRLKTVLKKDVKTQTCAESWELSGLTDDVSVVVNGFLKDNDLQELIEIYMGDLVGDKIFERFGTVFPILVKFIDAREQLSVQVHPDDDEAAKRYNAYGKTEMWYVMEADENSKLYVGFNQKMDEDKMMDAIGKENLEDVMNCEKVAAGDVFFIPAKRIHSIGENILLAEIQQTSDITFRIDDWGRFCEDENRNITWRELHIVEAVEVLDYSQLKECKTEYRKPMQETATLVECQYFTTNIVCFDKPMTKDYNSLDSFVIYVCVSGECSINWGNTTRNESICKGETVLIPAVIDCVQLIPNEATELLEIYIKL